MKWSTLLVVGALAFGGLFVARHKDTWISQLHAEKAHVIAAMKRRVNNEEAQLSASVQSHLEKLRTQAAATRRRRLEKERARYLAARKAPDPVSVLRNQVRQDIGRFPSFSPEAIEALRALYAEHPGWNAQLHHDNLRVKLAQAGIDSCPSYPSVLRYLKFHGLLRRQPPRRSSERPWEVVVGLQAREIRSYEVEYVLQLMHLDFHHGSRKVLTREGRWIKPLLVSFIDDRSRFLCHAQWYTNERTEELVHGLCQALQKVGLPRSIMSDRGSAMISGEFTTGLHRLGVLHLPTRPRSPHVNGKQENWWTRVESRLMAMLEGEASLSLEQLNLATQAWVTQEYHRTRHREIDGTPLERFLAGEERSGDDQRVDPGAFRPVDQPIGEGAVPPEIQLEPDIAFRLGGNLFDGGNGFRGRAKGNARLRSERQCAFGRGQHC